MLIYEFLRYQRRIGDVRGKRGNGYVRMDGVFFKSLHGGTLASGHVAIIQAGYDGSSWTNNQWIDDQHN